MRRMKYVPIFSFIPIVAAAWLAVENIVENALRASGCAGYDGDSAFKEGLFSAFPSIMLLTFVLLSHLGKALALNTLLASILYFAMLLHSYIHDKINNYAPCDYKGDESSLGNFLLGLVIVGVLVFVTFLYELLRLIMRALKGYKMR
jgi:hypothetical protein